MAMVRIRKLCNVHINDIISDREYRIENSHSNGNDPVLMNILQSLVFPKEQQALCEEPYTLHSIIKIVRYRPQD